MNDLPYDDIDYVELDQYEIYEYLEAHGYYDDSDRD